MFFKDAMKFFVQSSNSTFSSSTIIIPCKGVPECLNKTSMILGSQNEHSAMKRKKKRRLKTISAKIFPLIQKILPLFEWIVFGVGG